MLDGLDEINWAGLHHAYGSAADVPGLIRALLSEDPKTRDEALYELHGNIAHQGTVYEATVYALPFLNEILLSGEAPDRDGVAFLIAVIAGGTGYMQRHAVGERAPFWDDLLRKQDKSLDVELTSEHQITSAVRLGAAKVLHLLLPYLEHPVPEFRMTVASALGYYEDQVEVFLPLLCRALEREEDEAAQEAMRESIARLAGGRLA